MVAEREVREAGEGPLPKAAFHLRSRHGGSATLRLRVKGVPKDATPAKRSGRGTHCLKQRSACAPDMAGAQRYLRVKGVPKDATPERKAKRARDQWAIVDSNHGPPPYQSGALTD